MWPEALSFWWEILSLLLFGKFASFDWFLAVLVFFFFFRRHITFGASCSIVHSLFYWVKLRRVTHPLGFGSLGLNFCGHPSGFCLNFWVTHLVSSIFVFVHPFVFVECLSISRGRLSFMPMAWWQLSLLMSLLRCYPRSWTSLKFATCNLFLVAVSV